MINIKYCNNIDSAIINLDKHILNIKYAINGTGKTTIAKAIKYSVKDISEGTTKLKELKPFKYLGVEEINPEITGLEEFNNIMLFDEDYVNQYTFHQDEIVKNSFDIFINNDKYKEGIDKINQLVIDLRNSLQNNEEINNFIIDLNNLISYGKSTKSGISAASVIGKGLGDGNLLENIPTELNPYKHYLKCDENIKWLGWQSNGNSFIDISSDCCPYCTSGINTKKEVIKKVSEVYKPKNIEHLNSVIKVIEGLSKYFSDETNSSLTDIIKKSGGLSDDEQQYLLKILDESNQIHNKLVRLKGLNFHNLKHVEKTNIEEELNNMKIILNTYPYFKSDYTQKKIDSINSELDKVIKKIGFLIGAIELQKITVKETISLYKTEINDFLHYAGYNYTIDATEENEIYKLVLKHNDNGENPLNNAKNYLSYGERNAFALIIFMFESLNKKSDLIILDDPISSFDKNKKFAILNILFGNKVVKENLRNKSVLMLTHDFEPIIDIIYNQLPKGLENKTAYFLENDFGNIVETEINKKDIKSFIHIAEENIKTLSNSINKLIYLRRIFELNLKYLDAYEVLSNLFHKRAIPVFIDNITEIPKEIIANGVKIIIENGISDFEYKMYYELITDKVYMISLYENSTNNYEKLQIYRIIKDSGTTIEIESNVIRKFINESFHIENDYLFQLNPCKYKTVPQYVIDECSKDIEELK
ncbi:AAA family ATPase [Candidatus Gracilibacteria bacterium]|nr:AAA family ATPase [Candidatus Gracilibacteria bacterium]